VTLEQLAERLRIDTDSVREWAALGLIDPQTCEPAQLVERAGLLQQATRRGIDAQTIAAAVAQQGDLLERFTDYVGAPEGEPRSLADAAGDVGVDVDVARRLRAAAGLPMDEIYDEDVAALRALRTALDVGLPEEALLQLMRVFADALDRVADAEVRLFHFYVHERLRSQGLDADAVAAATTAAGDALMELVEPTILYFHRKAWTRVLREDMFLHFAEEVASPDAPVGELPVAVLFVDLASYTSLTEAMGDAAAAEVVDRFSQLVREESLPCDGRVVKQIGDEFMLVFPTAAAAVHCALTIAARAADEPNFPGLRMGAHAGTALYREADYLGATVNLAARVAAQAQRCELLVTAAVRDAAADSVAWRPVGARSLKGLSEPVDLFAADLTSPAPDRRIDPVCGMTIPAQGSGITVDWQGEAYEFCSEGCRQRFAADPHRFLTTT
jgi:adenylate cyclase